MLRRLLFNSGVAFGLAAVGLATFGTHAGWARVKEYQVNRLLLFKSSCKVDTLEDRSGPTGPLTYLAICENSTFYPDGVVVTCSDRDDERTCEIRTQPREFRNLDSLLRRQP